MKYPLPWKITREGSAYMEGTIITDPTGRWEIAGVWEEEDAKQEATRWAEEVIEKLNCFFDSKTQEVPDEV